jgi:sugar-specific transcriptional regulator TrmB
LYLYQELNKLKDQLKQIDEFVAIKKQYEFHIQNLGNGEDRNEVEKWWPKIQHSQHIEKIIEMINELKSIRLFEPPSLNEEQIQIDSTTGLAVAISSQFASAASPSPRLSAARRRI